MEGNEFVLCHLTLVVANIFKRLPSQQYSMFLAALVFIIPAHLYFSVIRVAIRCVIVYACISVLHSLFLVHHPQPSLSLSNYSLSKGQIKSKVSLFDTLRRYINLLACDVQYLFHLTTVLCSTVLHYC